MHKSLTWVSVCGVKAVSEVFRLYHKDKALMVALPPCVFAVSLGVEMAECKATQHETAATGFEKRQDAPRLSPSSAFLRLGVGGVHR